ncbi:MAG: hypothetical protein ACI8RD_012761, partial [Bacillariaceae sp.]
PCSCLVLASFYLFESCADSALLKDIFYIVLD